jgi:PhoPQ-activated pathogenicity-related protein
VDENYGWVEMPQHNLQGSFGNRSWVGYALNMTSQRWLTDADFAPNSDCKSLWWHYLFVIVPSEVKWVNNGTLWITGFSNTNSPPSADSEDIVTAAALAMSTGIITGSLFQVPNEHIIFAADPKQQSRSEDAVIAYTWDHFLNDPSQPEWLVRFPMVKASLRAMDAMKEFTQYKFPELGTSLDYFGVSGASKRGWTTWLVGAVDPKRVMLIIPVVLDAINFVAVEHHEYQSYGGWSWALVDYTDMDIMSRMDTPNMLLLQQMEDPYFYRFVIVFRCHMLNLNSVLTFCRDRLTMPKLVVNAVLDEFQQPDDTRYWWNDMPGPKHFIMTPNAEHSEITGILEICPDIIAYAQYLIHKETIPTFTWTISDTTGEIVATLDNHGVVHEVNMWYANSCGNDADLGIKRRDFRILSMDDPCKCGIAASDNGENYCANLKSMWNKQQLNQTIVNGKRTYSAKMDAPEDGRWVAFFIEVTYKRSPNLADFTIDGLSGPIKRDGKILPPIPHDLAGRLMFTTEVSVWPNVFPYKDCSGDTCVNQLV